MNENIKKGSEIHAGDGGYKEGTQEEYEKFAKIRNQSLAQKRIEEIGEIAHKYAEERVMLVDAFYQKEYDKKFAELIIKECSHAIMNDSRLNDVRSAANGCIRTITEHFGV